jgi:hypothetical protein
LLEIAQQNILNIYQRRITLLDSYVNTLSERGVSSKRSLQEEIMRIEKSNPLLFSEHVHVGEMVDKPYEIVDRILDFLDSVWSLSSQNREIANRKYKVEYEELKRKYGIKNTSTHNYLSQKFCIENNPPKCPEQL